MCSWEKKTSAFLFSSVSSSTRKPRPTSRFSTEKDAIPTTSGAALPTKAFSTRTTATSAARIPSRVTRPSPPGLADSHGLSLAIRSSWNGSRPFPMQSWSLLAVARPSRQCSLKPPAPPAISTSSTRRPMAFPIGTPEHQIFIISATTSTVPPKSKTIGSRWTVPPPRSPRRASSASDDI